MPATSRKAADGAPTLRPPPPPRPRPGAGGRPAGPPPAPAPAPPAEGRAHAEWTPPRGGPPRPILERHTADPSWRDRHRDRGDALQVHRAELVRVRPRTR